MPQVLVVSGFEYQSRTYAPGAVVTFNDAIETAWLKGRKLVEDDATIVAAAVSGGAKQLYHTALSHSGPFTLQGARDETTLNPDLSALAKLSVVAPRHVYNLRQSNMSNWIAGRAKAMAGQSAVVSIFADSTGAGAGAGSGGTTGLIGAKVRNLETKLAQSLKKRGVRARAGHFCGNNNVTSAAGITYDGTAGTSYCTQLAYTGTVGWSQQTLGGFMLRINANGEKVSWTPSHPFDQIVVTYVQNAGLATVAVDVDGGAALGSIVGAGSTAIKTAVINCTLGTHTVNLTSTTGGQFYIRSIKCIDTTRGGLDIMTPSYWGGLVNDFNGTSSAWSPGNCIGLDGQCLTIVKLMINDANGATSLATYQSGMETLLGRIKAANSDILLCSGDPFNGANYTNGKAATFVQNLKETLANKFDCPFLDLDGYFGPQTEQRPGYYYDNLHPTEVMYAEEGDVMAQTVMAV